MEIPFSCAKSQTGFLVFNSYIIKLYEEDCESYEHVGLLGLSLLLIPHRQPKNYIIKLIIY